MVKGFSFLEPSIPSIRRNGTPPQWSACRCDNRTASIVLCSIFCCRSPIRADKPKSRAKRYTLSVTKIQGNKLALYLFALIDQIYYIFDMKLRSLRSAPIAVIIFFLVTVQLSAGQPPSSEPRLEPDPLSFTFAESFDPSDWRSLFSLAYWVSGASDWEAAADFFTPAVEELSAETASMDERQKGEAVLEFMHKRFLKTYSVHQSRFDTLLSSKRYNCISSALLYAILATATGLEVSGVSVTDHAFCSVRVGEEQVDVETTNPHGFDPGTKMEFQDGFGKTTGFSYVPPGNYRDRASVDIKKLFSLVIYNHIVDAETAGRFPEAVGMAVDRWVLLGGGSGLEFEELIIRMLNNGALLSRAGREEEALAWADRAIQAYGPHPKWDDFLDGVVNNLLIKLLRAGRLIEARSRIDSLKPRLTAEAAAKLDLMVSDAELVAALKSVKEGGLESEFTSVLNTARLIGVVADDRILEIEVNWRLFSIEFIARAEGWVAAYEAIEEVIKELGSIRSLERAGKIYRTNHKTELYNVAALAYNSRRYEEAYSLVKTAMREFPDEQRFRTLLLSAERALAAGQ